MQKYIKRLEEKIKNNLKNNQITIDVKVFKEESAMPQMPA
jgi:hypothetical protein